MQKEEVSNKVCDYLERAREVPLVKVRVNDNKVASSNTQERRLPNQEMTKPFTLDDLAPYLNKEVDVLVVEECNALSEEMKCSLSLRDHWLQGADKRRLTRENEVPPGAEELLKGFMTTRMNDLDLLVKAQFEKRVFSTDCNVHNLIHLCAAASGKSVQCMCNQEANTKFV